MFQKGRQQEKRERLVELQQMGMALVGELVELGMAQGEAPMVLGKEQVEAPVVPGKGPAAEGEVLGTVQEEGLAVLETVPGMALEVEGNTAWASASALGKGFGMALPRCAHPAGGGTTHRSQKTFQQMQLPE